MTSILMELIQQIPESLSWRITTSVCSQLQPTGSHEQNWNVFKEMNPYIFNAGSERLELIENQSYIVEKRP